MAQMSTWEAADPEPGGAKSVVVTALWAAGAVGVVAAVAMWAYNLGARSPADVPAIRVALEDWRETPRDQSGAVLPGAASAAAARGAAAPVERPTGEDVDAAQQMGSGAFVALAEGAARGGGLMERRRSVDLDLMRAKDSALGDLALGKATAPPNVGEGAEPALQVAPPGTGPLEAAAAEPEPSPSSGAAGLEAAPPALSEPAAVEVTVGDEPPAAAEAPPSELQPVAVEVAAFDGEPETQVAAPQPAPAGGESERPTEAAILAPAPPSAAVAGPAMFQVQLGALDSVAQVEARWADLQAREPDLLGAFRLDIQTVNVEQTRLYRLRVGEFSSREEAARLCVTLRARGVDCFPATK